MKWQKIVWYWYKGNYQASNRRLYKLCYASQTGVLYLIHQCLNRMYLNFKKYVWAIIIINQIDGNIEKRVWYFSVVLISDKKKFLKKTLSFLIKQLYLRILSIPKNNIIGIVHIVALHMSINKLTIRQCISMFDFYY